MKKYEIVYKGPMFLGLTIGAGAVGCYTTLIAALYGDRGKELIIGCLFSYIGVLLPVIALEIAKFLCYEKENRKIYYFDIVGVSISFCILAVLFLLVLEELALEGNFWMCMKRDFLPIFFPWTMSFLIQGVLLIFKARKKGQTM